MENFFNNNPLADDLESWLENATSTTKTQFCENCKKLTKTIKSRESALKRVKSRIIATDKIIKQYQLKKNELGQTQQQLAFVTEKLKKSEKCSQTFQSKLTGLLNTDLLKDAKKDFEQRLAVKDLTIKELEDQLQFTTSEQKIFKDSSAFSLNQIEQLRDENRQQAKVIQSLEANQKRKIQQLERTKKEMDECKSCLAQMKKLSKSLEKEVSQMKEKNDKFVKILLDNGLLPKKELMAMNRKKKMQLTSAEDVPEVGIMSDDEDDDERVKEKKAVKPLLTIDINTIFEEFRAFPQMLSPLPADKESEQDSSMDGSEKSDNDLAKLLELEFLGTSELPEENAEESQTKAESVNSQNKSDLPTFSPASSSTNAISKSNVDDKSLLEAPLKQSASNMLKSVAVGHSASAEIELLSVGNLSDTDEENFEPPQKSTPLAPVLPKKTSSNSEKFLGNLSSDSDSDDEDLKTSSQSTHSSCIAMTKEPAYRKPDPSIDCTLKNLDQNLQPESPKLCNSQLNFGEPSSLSSEKSKEQSMKVVSVGDPVSTVVLDKQDHGMDHSFDSFKSSAKMADSLNPTDTPNTTSVAKDLNLCNDMKRTQVDMMNLFGSEYLSSSSDDDDDMNSTGNEPNILSVETNNGNRTVEMTPSTKANNQDPTNVINITSKTISFDKTGKNSTSSIEEQFSEDIPSLNKETSEHLLASKQLCLPVEQNTAVDEILGDSNIASNILLKIHETDLKNTSETIPCSEQLQRNSNQSLRKDLSSSLEMVTCADHKEIDETTWKEFNSSDVSAVDVSLNNADINSCLGNTSSMLKSLESTKPKESIKIITDSSEKEYVTNTLKENQESVVDQKRQSDIVVDKTIQLENVDICNKTPEQATIVDKVPEPVTVIKKMHEPVTVIEKTPKLVTVVDDKTPQAEPVGEKTPEPETIDDKTPQAESVVDKTPQAEPVGEKTPEPEPVDEKTPQAESIDDKTPQAEPVDDKTPQAEPVDDKTPQAEPVDDKTPQAEPVVDKTPEPEPVDEKTPEPEPVDDKTPQAEPIDDKTPRPETVDDKTPQAESIDDKTPQAEPVDDKTPQAEPIDDKTPQAEPVDDKTPEPEPVDDKMPEPEPVDDKTPQAEPVDDIMPEPEPVDDKMPEPEPVNDKMPEPEPVDDKMPEPEPVDDKMPEPGPVDDKMPEPEPVDDKTPQAEPVDDKMPEPEPVDDKMPEPGPVDDKMPEPEPVDDKMPEPEPVDDKMPEPGPVDDKMPEPGPVDDKMPEPEPVDDKMPEPGPVDDKTPQVERIDNKTPMKEPVHDKMPQAETVGDKTLQAEPVDDKTPEPEAVDDETPQAEPVSDKMPQAEPVGNKMSLADPVEDKTPQAEPVIDKTPQAESVDDKTPQAETVEDKTPQAKPVDEKTPQAKPVDEKTPQTETVDYKMPQTEPVLYKTPQAEPVLYKTPQAEPVKDKTPQAETVDEKTPQAETVDEKTPQAETVDEKMPQAETVDEKTPQAETVDEKTPQAETVDEKTPQAETVDEKTPQAETVDEKTPQAETVDEKTPQAETVDEKTPQAETVDEKTPQAETVDEKTPQAETVDEKTPQAETVDEKTPQAETVDEKTPQAETVDEKTPQAETVDEKTPQAETVDEKMPQAETVDEKTPQAETVDEKTPQAETVDYKTFKSIIVEKSIKLKSLFVDIRNEPKCVLEKLIQPVSPEKSIGLESVVFKKPLELESGLVVKKPLAPEAVIVDNLLVPEAVIVETPLEEGVVVVEKLLEPEAVINKKALEQEAVAVEKTLELDAVLIKKTLEPEAAIEEMNQSVINEHLKTEDREEIKKSATMTENSSVVAPVEKTLPQLLEPVSQNSCSHFFDDSLQTSIVSSQSQILNRVSADKSVDGPKTLKKQDKVTVSVENNSLAKKTKVLTETDINKVDPIQLSSFQSTCSENGSRDWDINSSLSSDKENEMMNISDRSMDPMKLSKTDTVSKQAYEDLYFLQGKSADMQDSQNIKNDMKLSNSQSSFENNEDTIGLVNDTENIPKRIGNDSTKENTQTIHNFNKVLKNVEISKSSSTDIGEIGAKCKSIEILNNNLENGDKQNKLSENLEKPALLKINSVNNVKELGIDVRLSESSLHVDSENRCLESPLISESVKENAEENGKESKDSSVLPENGNSESSQTVTKEKNKELESSLTTIEIISNSDCPKNSIKEIVENIEDSCGLLEDGETLECLDINRENISCMSAAEKSDHFGVSVTREEDGNSKVEETSALSRITSGNPSAEDDLDSLNTSGDGFSFEEFSDLEPPEIVPVPNSNHVNNVNINELFGEDDDVNQPDLESKETVKVSEEKNPTSSLSNSSLCRMNNTDSCGEGMNEIPVPLNVNKIEDEKDLSAVNITKKQFFFDDFDCMNPRKKRMPVFRMAIAPPKRQSKIGREHTVNNDSLGKAKTKDSVIKSVKRSFIKFVAANGKTYLPVELPDTSDHDTLSPSIREEKKDNFPADHASKNSDPLPEDSLPPSVIDLSENTECLQPKNHSFSESIFARERSEENNSNEILECIKEFILVTHPISPLPTSPVKSALPPCDHLSPPPKEQTIMQKNVSTPTNSNCDYLKDFQPFLSTASQLSPIITPHQLRKKRSKKCLLKDLASEEGSDIASNVVPKPFPKSVAADTNSTKCHSKKICHCVLDPDCSSHMLLPKSDAAEPNSTSIVDSSQPSADKTCLNSQQRLLRKTRSLRRILPPTATPHAKNPRLDSTTETNKMEQKELPTILTAAQLSLSSSKPKKVDRAREANPNTVGEELGVPAKEVSDPLKLEKVPSVDNSDDGKKRVKSVRKRKLDVTEDSADRDDKKQCLKNDAILSRARASLMKVAGREFQNYWKYVSTSASQVLQKLLQTNREAGLIVEVAAKQAVKLLSSTTENMLPWYITRCKSNIVTPYFSDKERHLLRLLCLFKKRKEMGNIFTTFRNYLKEALTKENWDSTSLGKWSLCRMFLAMCRLEGLLSEARVFFYTSLCQLPCEQYITLAVITACTWPLVLSYERNDGRISLFRVIEYAVLKSINEKRHNMKYLECLVKHCKWKPSGSSKNNDIQRSLFNHLHDCIEEGATKDEIFCYVKGIELLSFQEKWLWTVSLIRSRINNLLKKCLQLEPSEDRHQEFNLLLCFVFQMLGNLCMRSKKRHKIISFVVNSLLKPFLNSNKFSSDVHLCCAQVLMKLYPFEPIVVYPMLESWFQEMQTSEASSKLRNEWILLKSHLNKETGVT